MGFVWNVMLSFDNVELWEDGDDEPRETCEPLERINAWLPHGRLVSLIGPTYDGDSGNGMDANLYGGGFKHFDIEGFIEVVKAQDWKARSKVQLWIKGAEEGMGAEPFTLVKLGGRRAAALKAAATRKRRRPEPKPPRPRSDGQPLARGSNTQSKARRTRRCTCPRRHIGFSGTEVSLAAPAGERCHSAA